MDPVQCHIFCRRLIIMFVFDILHIFSGYIAPICTLLAVGLFQTLHIHFWWYVLACCCDPLTKKSHICLCDSFHLESQHGPLVRAQTIELFSWSLNTLQKQIVCLPQHLTSAAIRSSPQVWPPGLCSWKYW